MIIVISQQFDEESQTEKYNWENYRFFSASTGGLRYVAGINNQTGINDAWSADKWARETLGELKRYFPFVFAVY